VNYINTFLKLKAEASGYPSCVRTPTDENLYIQNFFDNGGIMLDKYSMQLNDSKRALATQSQFYWGKLRQRNNRKK
jgi:hypothetical protein